MTFLRPEAAESLWRWREVIAGAVLGLTGGTVALREMQSLTLERNMYPAHWRLEQPGQSALLIPVNAAGSEALFDAFATLPGIRTERMLGELRAGGVQSVVIWQRQVQRPPVRVLH